MKFEWEKISGENEPWTLRAKVFGGWIVHTSNESYGQSECSLSESMVFIPDPNHEWKIEKP